MPEMRLAIMQPYFLPYIGYWQLMAAADKFVVYDDVNYIKGGWINRNRILIGGQACYLTVPLVGASPNRLINEISISPMPLWRNKLRRSVELAYSKAPYFEAIFPVIDEIIRYDAGNLSGYLLNQLDIIRRLLGLETVLVTSSAIYENKHLSAQQRVLDICQQERADVYLNSAGGRMLYAAADFARRGLRLGFVQPEVIRYPQFGAPFIPSLSIVDVLMFNGIEGTKQMLGRYEIDFGERVEA